MWESSSYGPAGYDTTPVGYPGYGAGGYGPGGYGPPPPRRRRGSSFLSHLAVAVLAAALGVGVSLAVDHPTNSGSTISSGSANSPSTSLPGARAVPTPAPSGGTSVGSEQQVISKVEPGVVLINTVLQYNSEEAAGTGMIINSDGLVLTNNHVIDDATKITVTVPKTGKTYSATVLGYDTTGDIALIKLNGASGLPTIPIGNSSSIKTGDAVVALGNAEGQGSVVPAAGEITGVNQTITASDEGGSIGQETLHNMLETNADIVSGDSGGPLSDSAGQVIGMDTAGNTVSFTQQQAAGFAIPINTALSVARQIAAGQASSTVTIGYPPFLGIFNAGGNSSNPQTQAQEQNGGFGGFGGFGGGFGGGGNSGCYNSNENVTVPNSIAPVSSGTLVDGVVCGSPADAAGITAGSVITAIDGNAVGSPDTLESMLDTYRPGDTISVTWVSPAGQTTTSKIQLIAGPPA